MGAGRQVQGSIPAHAGEPLHPPIPPISPEVYPRPCGGTDSVRLHLFPLCGLSPPMRGNQPLIAYHRHHCGSIPAHAGEPVESDALYQGAKVYPRPCGGTSQRGYRRANLRGLSPPMRGNRTEMIRYCSDHGSIPAHAGEPETGGGSNRRPTVYPRPCGGTVGRTPVSGCARGLSPPMRLTALHFFRRPQSGRQFQRARDSPTIP